MSYDDDAHVARRVVRHPNSRKMFASAEVEPIPGTILCSGLAAAAGACVGLILALIGDAAGIDGDAGKEDMSGAVFIGIVLATAFLGVLWSVFWFQIGPRIWPSRVFRSSDQLDVYDAFHSFTDAKQEMLREVYTALMRNDIETNVLYELRSRFNTISNLYDQRAGLLQTESHRPVLASAQKLETQLLREIDIIKNPR